MFFTERQRELTEVLFNLTSCLARWFLRKYPGHAGCSPRVKELFDHSIGTTILHTIDQHFSESWAFDSTTTLCLHALKMYMSCHKTFVSPNDLIFASRSPSEWFVCSCSWLLSSCTRWAPAEPGGHRGHPGSSAPRSGHVYRETLIHRTRWFCTQSPCQTSKHHAPVRFSFCTRPLHFKTFYYIQIS